VSVEIESYTWPDEPKISAGQGQMILRRPDGTIHIIFMEYDNGDGKNYIYHRYSENNGRTWSNKALAMKSAGSGIDVRADRVFTALMDEDGVVYLFGASTESKIYLSTYNDSWPDSATEVWDGGIRPVGAINLEGHICIVYYEDYYRVAISKDDGATWTEEILPNIIDSTFHHPIVITDGARFFIYAVDLVNDQTIYKMTYDGEWTGITLGQLTTAWGGVDIFGFGAAKKNIHYVGFTKYSTPNKYEIITVVDETMTSLTDEATGGLQGICSVLDSERVYLFYCSGTRKVLYSLEIVDLDTILDAEEIITATGNVEAACPTMSDNIDIPYLYFKHTSSPNTYDLYFDAIKIRESEAELAVKQLIQEEYRYKRLPRKYSDGKYYAKEPTWEIGTEGEMTAGFENKDIIRIVELTDTSDFSGIKHDCRHIEADVQIEVGTDLSSEHRRDISSEIKRILLKNEIEPGSDKYLIEMASSEFSDQDFINYWKATIIVTVKYFIDRHEYEREVFQ